jgi:hypothetical protein
VAIRGKIGLVEKKSVRLGRAMAKDREYWKRKEHFDKYGVWPASAKKAPLSAAQGADKAAKPVIRDTNLSLQYDNDGNPIHGEPGGYTKDGGH